MSITIYHNPRCRKSREALAFIRDAGHEPEIIEYLKVPLTPAAFDALLKKLGKEPREAMRTKEAVYKELGLADKDLDRGALIQIMLDNPKLIERPIVVSDKGAIIARPPELVRDIL